MTFSFRITLVFLLYRHTSTTTASQHEVTKEALLRPLSLFPWIEDATSKSGSGNSKLKQQQIQQQMQASEGAGQDNAMDRSTSTASRPSSMRLNSVTSNTYKVCLYAIICVPFYKQNC